MHRLPQLRHCRRDMARRQARAALEAVLPEIIRRAKQDAWYGGWQANVDFIRTGVLTNNPYCTETDEENPA